MHLTILLFHPSELYSKLIKQANIMVQRYLKYIASLLSQHRIDNSNFCHIAFLNILLFITVKLRKFDL